MEEEPQIEMQATKKHEIVLYHVNWGNYGRKHFVKDLQLEKLCSYPNVNVTIAYAFFNIINGVPASGDSYADFDKRYISATEGVEPFDNWNDNTGPFGLIGQFTKVKNALNAAGKNFNLQLSVGGWSWSSNFSSAMATEASRKAFVDSLVSFLKKYPVFSGVSLDWEYLSDDGINYGNGGNGVSKDDAKNFMAMLKYLRQQMPKLTIAFCVVAAPEKIKFPVAEVCALVDEVHVMTYDFADGNWGESLTTHHTNLYDAPYTKYSVDKAVKEYIEKYKVPASKLFIGAAYYSRGFSGTKGLGQNDAKGGSSDMSWEKGVCDYKSLPREGAKEYFDDVCKASYSYDPVKQVFNSYDTVESIKAKCDYVKRKGIRGIIVWETSGDHPFDHPKSLTACMLKNLSSSSGSMPVPPNTPDLPKPKPPISQPKPPVSSPTTDKGLPVKLTIVSEWATGATIDMEFVNTTGKDITIKYLTSNLPIVVGWSDTFNFEPSTNRFLLRPWAISLLKANQTMKMQFGINGAVPKQGWKIDLYY